MEIDNKISSLLTVDYGALARENEIVKTKGCQNSAILRQHRGQQSVALDQCIGVNPYFNSLIYLEPVIIGHLTWNIESHRHWTIQGNKLRKGSFLNLMYLLCLRLNLRFKDIRYYFKHERKESGETHGHFLIFRDGLKGSNPAIVADAMKDIWVNGYLREGKRGTAVIEQIKNISDAVGYVCKRVYNERRTEIDTFDLISDKLRNEIRKHNEVNCHRRN